MPVKPVDISVFECKLDLRRTGGSLTIHAANDESDLNPPSYEVRPNQSVNDDYVDVLRRIADALENNQEAVTLSVENNHFIVKTPTVDAVVASASRRVLKATAPAAKPAKRKAKAKAAKPAKKKRG
jgi:BRCT domain type II-containing protein